MMGFFDQFALPLLHSIDAERAHNMTVFALEHAPLPAAPDDDPLLALNVFGLDFRNPLGMAAGFDKDARVPDALLQLGFGFTEVGTITPRPQPGNPKPRLFRLHEDRGVINRFGFNNNGHAAARSRLLARHMRGGVVGVNIGANKDSTDRAADYVAGINTFADIASYFTVNISSPNTPGLRDLQQASALDDLLARVLDARDLAAETGPRRPVLLKIAPDLALPNLDDVVRVARDRGVDGMIVSNTTLSRPDILRDDIGCETGGLSGSAAVRARDPDARPDLCARGKAVSADRRRRRGSARKPPGPRSKPARPWCSFIRRWYSRAWGSSSASRPDWSRICKRAA